MAGIRAMPLALAVLGGLVLAGAFPPVDVGVLAFLAPVPLLIGIRRVGPAGAAGLGWVFGTIACTLPTASSLLEASSRYFAHSAAMRLVFALAMPQIHGALYFAVFGWAAQRLLATTRNRVPPALTVPAAWVACEFARASIGHGGPWLLVAHSQHAALPVLQVADLAGSYGVSFVVLSASTGLALLLEMALGSAPPRALGSVCIGGAVIAGAFLYGHAQLIRWHAVGDGREQPLRIALVQGRIPLAWRRSASRAGAALDRLRELTATLASARPDLIVWPENAVGFAVAANESLFAGIGAQLGPQGRLLLGAPHAVETSPGHVEFRNSAFLLDPSGRIETRYDKLRLTPFAEYAPWPIQLLARRRVAARDVYAPGDAWTLFEAREVPFAVLICFEAIYPPVIRHFVGAGARVLVNISNDDWFGHHAALAQHLGAALLGAVAYRRPLVRATNTGITAVVAPTGAIVARAPTGIPATLVVDVAPVRTLSVYARVGDVFAWLCVVGALVAIGLPDRPRRS